METAFKLSESHKDLTLEQLKEAIQTNFQELNISYRKNLSGKHLIVSSSSTVGFGIWIKKGRVYVDSVIPNMMWLLLGVGSIFVFWFNVKQRDALEALLLEFLSKNYCTYDKITTKTSRKKYQLSTDDINLMAINLKDVIIWTEFLSKNFDYKDGNYGTVFRQTNPEIDGNKLYNIKDNYSYWNVENYSTTNYEKALSYALGKRRERNRSQNTDPLEAQGRILVFHTQISTHDATAMIESNGFVDVGDTPPIDTWFYLKEEFYNRWENYSDLTLFCWIPKSFENKMQTAIDVEILASYDWLDELSPEINRQIFNTI